MILLALLVSLLFFSQTYANVVFPFFITPQVLSWVAIPASIVLELIVLTIMLGRESKVKYSQIFGVTLLMNLASAFVGFLITVTGFLVHIFRYIVPKDNIVALFIYALATVALNTIIESGVAISYFKTINRKKLIWAIALANIASAGVTLLYFRLVAAASEVRAQRNRTALTEPASKHLPKHPFDAKNKLSQSGKLQ